MKFSFKLFDKRASKVHVFWEGHKNWQYLHRPTIWQYVITVKSTVKISSIFVSFFENMNFTDKSRFKKDCSINQNFTKPKKWPDLRKENSTNWVFLVVLDSFYLFPKNYFQPTSFLYRNLSAWIKWTFWKLSTCKKLPFSSKPSTFVCASFKCPIKVRLRFPGKNSHLAENGGKGPEPSKSNKVSTYLKWKS